MTIGGAIAELQNLINADDVPFYYKGGIEKVIETISMEILTTEQSSKVGEWIKDDNETYICSACGSGYKDQPTCVGKPMFAYCPICGAKMKGGGR